MPFLFDLPTPLDDCPLDLVVHIGAGNGDVLDAYDHLAWQRLVLVEGDSDAAAELQAAVAGRAHIQVEARVVAPQAGSVEWHRHAPASVNGPRPARALTPIYPRLRELSVAPVDAAALRDVLARHARDDRRPHLLVMDVPGQECDLLRGVDGDLLRRFEWILLRGYGLAASPGWVPAPAAVEHLRSEGFASVETGASDPAWPQTLLRFDANAYRLRRLGDALAAAEAERSREAERVAQQAAELARLGQALASARAECDRQSRLVADSAAQLERAGRERDEAGRLAAERQSQSEAAEARHAADLAALRNQHGEREARHAADLAALRTQHDEREARHSRLVADLRAQIDALTRDIAARQGERQVLAQDLGRVQADLQRQVEVSTRATKALQDAERTHAERVKVLEGELAAARQAAALSLKLQMLREADLRELQQRYGAALTEQQSQHELLTKLGQRLTLANQYFSELARDGATPTPPPAKKLRRAAVPGLAAATPAPPPPTAPKRRAARKPPSTP